MVNLVKIDSGKLDLSKMNNSTFYERVYHSLVLDGNNINYGDFCSRIMKNGAPKVFKSLGLYKTTGARDNKIIFAHPKLLLEMRMSISSNDELAKTIIDLVDGLYVNVDKYIIDSYDEFFNLSNDYPHSIEYGKCTYLIYNETNGLHKIGRSVNIFNRLKSLRASISPLLEISAYLDRDIEGELHKLYSNKRVFGEWFNLNSDDILDIKNKYGFNILKLYLVD